MSEAKKPAHNLDTSPSLMANKEVFLERLIAAGWPKEEAEEEWRNIQEDEEGNL